MLGKDRISDENRVFFKNRMMIIKVREEVLRPFKNGIFPMRNIDIDYDDHERTSMPLTLPLIEDITKKDQLRRRN